MLKERTKLILEAGVRNYIETGEPVTSNTLFYSYDFGIRPAMIRSELNILGEAGYFLQNHPSGGRIPTEKAYKFFVQRVLENEKNISLSNRLSVFTRELANNLFDGDFQSFIQEAAHYLELFGVGYETEEDRIYESGMYDLFLSVDTEKKNDLLNIARDIESIEGRIDKLEPWLLQNEVWPQVFIGEESPFTKSNQLSVIANRFSVNGDPFLLFMIGPTRMNYQKSLRFLRSLERSIEKNN